MNAFIKKSLPIAMLFLFALWAGCSKDMDDEPSLLGNWIEESPVAERTELYFHSGNRLSIKKSESITDNFSYRIDGDRIVIWMEGESETDGSSTLYFRQLDENTFQIENLYPSIPEMEPSYMIFTRL